MKKIISLILLIAWSLLIFCFSSDNGIESSSLSGKVTDVVIDVLSLKPNEKQKETIHTFIRKTAHFTEYFILGVLIVNCLINFKISKYYLLYAILIGVIYAISDEIHQVFVSGRVGSPVDVLIDSCGVITSVGFINLIRSKHEKRN